MQLFEGLLPIRIERAEVSLPIRANIKTLDNGQLAITAEAELSPVLPAATSALRSAISAFPGNCEHRLSLKSTDVSVPGETLEVRIGLRYELWVCRRVLGNEIKTKILRESGTLRGWLKPRVSNGRLQLKLQQFRVDGLGEVSKWLNVEDRIRREVEAAITKLNRDPKFADLPDTLRNAGFAYKSVALSNDGMPKLAVAIAGPGGVLTLLRIWDALREGRL